MKEYQDNNKEKGEIKMATTVQKWGNSLAIRIPSVIAESISIQQGSEIEFNVQNQIVQLIPKKKKPTLEELCARITPENRHEEIDFGGPVGRELL